MNKDFAREFEILEDWAREVARKLGTGFDISGKRETILEDSILCATFFVDTELPASDVTNVLRETSENYRRGRRYFFLFDKPKKFLFLLFYPYYILMESTNGEMKNGRRNKEKAVKEVSGKP